MQAYLDGAGLALVANIVRRRVSHKENSYGMPARFRPPCTEDRMIPPDGQRAMSKRADSTVSEVKSSHAVYVSQPKVALATR